MMVAYLGWYLPKRFYREGILLNVKDLKGEWIKWPIYILPECFAKNVLYTHMFDKCSHLKYDTVLEGIIYIYCTFSYKFSNILTQSLIHLIQALKLLNSQPTLPSIE